MPDGGCDTSSPLRARPSSPPPRSRAHRRPMRCYIGRRRVRQWQLRHFLLTKPRVVPHRLPHPRRRLRRPQTRYGSDRTDPVLRLDRCGVGSGRRGEVQGWAVSVGVFRRVHDRVQASWPLSDSFLRRKGAVTLTSSINDVSGLATAFSPAFPSTRLRFVTALHGGLGVSVFTLTTKRRLLRSSCHVAMCTFLFFALGSILLSLASLSTPSWRSLYIISSVPSVIFVIVVVPFIAESPRWHLVHGDVTAAMATMRSIAKTNGKDLPDNVFLALDDRKAAQENKKDAARSTIIDVIRSQVTGPRSPLSSSSTFHSIAYYGLTAECQNLRHGPAHSVDLNAAAEMPPTP
ncbi:uncharacterized protein A4U43_C06F2520 [Asparagus officinalis]|uniref:H(+)/Pi cotransporter n=1 Tax=Asparagus officinalis TaxID=4686 RepID=A0A5P1EL60_ASPOF|nr:uncharacterized protein A4U43_C06F2520 [Asparagus officinalis]